MEKRSERETCEGQAVCGGHYSFRSNAVFQVSRNLFLIGRCHIIIIARFMFIRRSDAAALVCNMNVAKDY